MRLKQSFTQARIFSIADLEGAWNPRQARTAMDKDLTPLRLLAKFSFVNKNLDLMLSSALLLRSVAVGV
jgi:hypothetical protein